MNLMALTLVGLASMSRLRTMKPSSFPDRTPTLVVAAIYRRRTSPFSGAVRTGGEVRKSLSSWNALEASSFHSNLSDFWRS